ncbi:MAG TPA: hypothetical protein VEV65_04450 [Kineosporiaceae bacterium]|nr:hypothetical protein [Kineosporiaceae bacterium]
MAGAERGELVRAFESARAADDVDAMAAAALRIVADRRFGAPAAAPGYLHTAYLRATGEQRIRLATELARAWAYAGEPDRAAPFAREAVAGAEESGDALLLATALDADLLVHWGPDDLDARTATAARLDGLTARLTDVEARLTASLWRLTTALECLDAVAVQRQLRLLDDLADESGSPRVRMFAASRRGMYALVVGDVVAAGRLLEEVRGLAATAGEPDGEALVHVLTSGIARQTGDVQVLAAEAADYEAFATEHGIRSILAEAALLRLEAREPERAAAALDQALSGGPAAVPRDVDWLLTLATASEVAARTGSLDTTAELLELLEPFAGRAVVNAGGVAFAGVVDDYLRLAATALGREEDAARWAESAAAGYRRLGARWWLGRLSPSAPPGRPAVSRVVLAPSGDDVWLVGPEGREVPVRAVKGLRYLSLLLARPHVELTALDMAAAVAGHAVSVSQGDLGATLDRRALAEYRRRIGELDAELAQAREWADEERAARLAAERGLLLDEIARATGFAGRHRVTGASAERARVAVQKSVAAALRRITDADAGTGRLLRDTVRTGTTCCYDPDPARPTTWVLGLPRAR